MADIQVERKGPSIWPWIVGLLVVALLAWALIEMFGREDLPHQPVVADTVELGREANPPPPQNP